MSYNPTSFVGLEPGSVHGGHNTYTAQVTAGDSEGQMIGTNRFCPTTYPGHTFLGEEVDQILCGDNFGGATVGRDLADATSSGFPGGDPYTDLDPPPDFFTLYVQWGTAPDGMRSVAGIPTAYSNACMDYGLFGPECDGIQDIHYYLDAAGIEPADVFGDGSYIADGSDKSLEGYVSPAVTLYDGDPTNTASSLLWLASDPPALSASVSAEFHAMEIDGGLKFIIRPFWLPDGGGEVTPTNPIICFV